MGMGGGVDCAGCTMVIGLLEQLSQVHNETVDKTMDRVCSYMPFILQAPCQTLILQYGAQIIEEIEQNHATPDVVCRTIALCTLPTCNLYPAPSSSSWKQPIRFDSQPQSKQQSIQKPDQQQNRKYPTSRHAPKQQQRSSWTPWDWVWERIQRVFNTHKPFFDDDGDNFSTYFALRGTYWRGADCNDENPSIYPGRRSPPNPSSDVDYNCNSISGSFANGTSYKDLYCSSTPQYGISVLGDSATAHFHIPPSYITASLINSTSFSSLLDVLEMEGDWPELSAAMGTNTTTAQTWAGSPQGPVNSMYLYNLQQNRCSKNDYQSIAVNGARCTSMNSTIIESFARNANFDHASITGLALLGNDVCNPHPGYDHMTPPALFQANIQDILKKLDTMLPKGSFVTIMGLIDGRILYDTMANRIHPIGSLRKDVTYKTFYNFMNCLEISPCWGWMNDNATARNETTKRAESLNAVYKDIIKGGKWKNFNVTYFDCPMKEVVTEWERRGGKAWELIEPVDGFHPTQISQALTAEYQWNMYQKGYKYLVPPVNPYNHLIRQKFGY
eukprot:TRINITY_DN18241_c0_g1_i1.p1 TRINITY_DN18241_c0_g1~~TRINITY_DN18241_c0_g1_i1.p1  ORF type:complete len:605 (-),score=131.95 TRINITY_DN18241_c0_g1_i1:49-1719(-)